MRLFVHRVWHSLQPSPLPRRPCSAPSMLSDSMMEVKAAKQKPTASGYTYLLLVYLLPPPLTFMCDITRGATDLIDARRSDGQRPERRLNRRRWCGCPAVTWFTISGHNYSVCHRVGTENQTQKTNDNRWDGCNCKKKRVDIVTYTILFAPSNQLKIYACIDFASRHLFREASSGDLSLLLHSHVTLSAVNTHIMEVFCRLWLYFLIFGESNRPPL